MAVLAPFLVLCAYVLGFHHVAPTADTLSSSDSSFCFGGLEVIYPELRVDRCIEVQEGLRQNLSKVWGAPEVSCTKAEENKTYVLLMVDPDAPSREKANGVYWRHWLLVDVKGASLKTGKIKGKTITEYHRPTPPKGTDFHRYQFVLFRQPPGTTVSLTEQESSSRGKWNVSAFIDRNGLGDPVATVQFLTKNCLD